MISAINKCMLGRKQMNTQMRRYPPSTIRRYLDLSSTQRFQTHPPPPTTLRAKHIPRTTLILNTSETQYLNHVYHPHVLHSSSTPALPSTSPHHTLSADTHATQTTIHASQSQQPPHPHRVPRQTHRHNTRTHTQQ